MPLRVVMLGASGTVGREVMDPLCNKFALATLTLLNRRPLPHASGAAMVQHIVDVLNPQTYKHLLGAHQAAVCAVGVGQPISCERCRVRARGQRCGDRICTCLQRSGRRAIRVAELRRR